MMVKNRKGNIFDVEIIRDGEQLISNDGQVLYIKEYLLNKYLKTGKLIKTNYR
jgi:hypothetical protein